MPARLAGLSASFCGDLGAGLVGRRAVSRQELGAVAQLGCVVSKSKGQYLSSQPGLRRGLTEGTEMLTLYFGSHVQHMAMFLSWFFFFLSLQDNQSIKGIALKLIAFFLRLPFPQIIIFKLNTGLMAGGFLLLSVFRNVLKPTEICPDFASVKSHWMGFKSLVFELAESLC